MSKSTKKAVTVVIEKTPLEKVQEEKSKLFLMLAFQEQSLAGNKQEIFIETRKALATMQDAIDQANRDLNYLEQKQENKFNSIEDVLSRTIHALAWGYANASTSLQTANRRIAGYIREKAQVELITELERLNKEEKELQSQIKKEEN